MACSTAQRYTTTTTGAGGGGLYSSSVSNWNCPKLPKNFLESEDTEFSFSEAESIYTEQGFETATVVDSDDEESSMSVIEQTVPLESEAMSSDYLSDSSERTVKKFWTCLTCSSPCQMLYCNACYSERMSNVQRRRKIEKSIRKHEIKTPKVSLVRSSKNPHTLIHSSNVSLKSEKRKKLGFNYEEEIIKRREELPKSMLLQSLQRESQIVRNFKFNVHETSQRCMSCKIRPRDACFVHTKITHQVCCMKCAKQIYQSNNKRCPICYRRIEKITKNIVA